MGTDISIILEVRDNAGVWQLPKSMQVPGMDFTDSIGYNDFPLGYRSYSLFGFLADVRNTAMCPSIADHRGLPADSLWLNSPGKDYLGGTNASDTLEDGNDYSHSWVTLAELLAFNYEQTFENLRLGVKTITGPNSFTYHGNVQGKEGEGQLMTVRDHLGETYFEHLKGLQTFGEPENVRLIFWFN